MASCAPRTRPPNLSTPHATFRSVCGRFTQTDPERIVSEFSITGQVVRFDAGPRYNVAPSQLVAVVRVKAPGKPRELDFLKWGLVTSGAVDPRGGIINARVETLRTKRSFRGALPARRCLVVADGFYEWQRRGRTKQPYYITRTDGALLAMAGLWERWTTPDGEVIETFAIVTKPSEPPVVDIHDRMPAIVAESHHAAWLEPASVAPPGLEDMLLAPSPALRAVPVSTLVNKPANDGPRCIEPVALQPGLFDS